MKRTIVSLLAAFGLLLVVSNCPGPNEGIPPPTKGIYNGRYSVTHEYGNDTGEITTDQWIEWTFTDYKFYSRYDSTEVGARSFCDVSGKYELKNDITFTDTLVSAQDCDHGDVPIGSFNLLIKPGEDGIPDSIFMEQIEGDVRKVIVLEQEF